MPTPKPDEALQDWLAALAAPTPAPAGGGGGALAAPTAAPAGGAAAALAGSLGAALVQMVAGLTLAREKYASTHDEAAATSEHAARLRQAMLTLASRDAEAFDGFVRALRLPAGQGHEPKVREPAKADALHA